MPAARVLIWLDLLHIGWQTLVALQWCVPAVDACTDLVHTTSPLQAAKLAHIRFNPVIRSWGVQMCHIGLELTFQLERPST